MTGDRNVPTVSLFKGKEVAGFCFLHVGSMALRFVLRKSECSHQDHQPQVQGATNAPVYPDQALEEPLHTVSPPHPKYSAVNSCWRNDVVSTPRTPTL